MKKIYNFIKNPYILAILSYSAILFQLDTYSNYNAYKFLFLVAFIGIVVLFKKFDFDSVEKRLRKYSLILSSIISAILIVGRTVMKNEFIPTANLFTIKSIIFNIVFTIFLIPLIYICTIHLFKFLEKLKLSKDKTIKNKWFWTISFIVICLGKIPYLLSFYPANMTVDSFNVINLFESGSLFNQHPVAFTYFFGLIYSLGKILLGRGSLAICFYSIFQIVIIAVILTWILKYLNEKGVNKYIIYLLLVYFSLSPDYGYMSMTLWKDILFGIAFIPLILSFTKIAEKDIENNKPRLKDLIVFIVSSLMILFFRHNGIYIYIFAAISIPFLLKKNKKMLSIVATSMILIYFIITGPIYNKLNVIPGKTVETYSVLLQQVGRVYLKKGDIDKESDKYFHDIIDIENIEKKYLTWIADPMKNLTNTQKLKDSQSEFFKAWFKTFLKNPGIYIESFLSSSVGYWYPDVVYISVREGGGGTSGHYDVTKHGIYRESLMPEKIVEIFRLITNKSLPLVMVLWSLGFSFILLLTSFVLSLYFKIKKQYYFIYFPLIALWLTNVIAAPVYCEYRYIYGMIVCNILLCAVPLVYKNNAKRIIK